MSFGYNADVAFGNTTADIIDHAKSLLTSLIDKREEDEVGCRYLLDRSGRRHAETSFRSCEDRLYLSDIRSAG